MFKFVFILGLLASPAFSQTQMFMASLRPFYSDGCTVPFAKGVLAGNSAVCGCCVQHDFDYWKGGTPADRKSSDRSLQRCVGRSNPLVAQLFHKAVRIGGDSKIIGGKFWGSGWRYIRNAVPLNRLEKLAVRASTYTDMVKDWQKSVCGL